MVNAYRRISLFGHEIQVPNTPLRELVDVHMVPDFDRSIMYIRLWWKDTLVHSLSLPLDDFRVRF